MIVVNRGIALQQIRQLCSIFRGDLAAHEVIHSMSTMSRHSPTSGKRVTWELGFNFANLHHVMVQCTHPKCSQHGCNSYAEFISKEPQRPDFYLNYNWSMPLQQIVAALEWHAEALELLDTTSYWWDVFSINTYRENKQPMASNGELKLQ